MEKNYKKASRSIRHLIQSANKGNYESAYQLYINFSEGKNVEKEDSFLAGEYLSIVESGLIKNRFTLKSLRLTDFKRFRSLNLSFDERMTVIIGDNGAGKTSIAEAITIIFSWFNNNLEKTDVVGKPIKVSDINVDANEYCEVTAEFNIGDGYSFDSTVGSAVAGYTGRSPTDVFSIKRAANMYKSVAKNPSVMIPLLAFYSVERSDFKLSPHVTEKAFGDGFDNRFLDIKSSLDGNGKFDDFSKIYIELVNLAEGEESNELKKIKDKINAIEGTLDLIYGEDVPHDDKLNLMLKELKSELLLLSLDSSSDKYKRHLSFVNSAIYSLMPSIKNLKVDRSQGKARLLVENFGVTVNVAQLSQGQRILLALAGDLARRLVKLNPDSDFPLHGHGIVVIDEIELHLHPRWQQEALLGLQKAFPNLQFIVTTHSPQVLSTVDKSCIRIIRFSDDGSTVIDTPEYQTKGISSADILEQIMGVFSTPVITEATWVSEYLHLIQSDLWDKEEGKILFEKIINHFGEEHPVVIKILGEVRVQEFKRKVAKKRKESQGF